MSAAARTGLSGPGRQFFLNDTGVAHRVSTHPLRRHCFGGVEESRAVSVIVVMDLSG